MEQSVKYFVLVLVAFTVAVVAQTSMLTLVSDYNVMAIAVHRCFETAADARPHASGCWESLRPVRCLTPLTSTICPPQRGLWTLLGNAAPFHSPQLSLELLSFEI